MKKEVICCGVTVEGAKQAALIKLSAPEDAEVKFEIIEEPKAKFLGIFGGSEAKVRAYYEEDDEIGCDSNENVAESEPVLPVEQSLNEEIDDSKFTQIKAYISAILKGFNIETFEIDVSEDEEGLIFNLSVEDDDARALIGKKGETLDALQYLIRLALGKTNKEYNHSMLNVGSYREKRQATLISLAKKNAARVRKYGRNVVLDPMSPYERRIIHTAIQELEGVESHSVGKDKGRKVVITLAPGFEPEVPYSQSGYNRGGYNKGSYNRSNYNKGGYNKGGYNKGGYNKGGRGGYNKKPAYKPDAPQREPKSDFDNAFTYGKIDI